MCKCSILTNPRAYDVYRDETVVCAVRMHTTYCLKLVLTNIVLHKLHKLHARLELVQRPGTFPLGVKSAFRFL